MFDVQKKKTPIEKECWDVRHVVMDVTYEGKNISDKINFHLLSATVNDNASNVADDISITLDDRDEDWLNKNIVNSGDKVNLQAVSYNWNYKGEIYRMKYGEFYVDEPEYTVNPSTFSLNALSVKANGNFRDVPHSNIWKSTTIKKIVDTIAKRNGYGIVYDTKRNYTIKELEQSEQTDFEFLKSLCSDNGLVLKLYDTKIVIFDEASYEQKEPVATITRNDIVGQINFRRKLTDCGYDKAVLKCKRSKNKGKITASFTRPGAKGNKVLALHDSVDTQAEALRVCQTKLREKNKDEYTVSFTMSGLSKINSAEVVKLEGFGQFDGKYYIDSKNQSFIPTSASFQAHRILGY